MIVLLVVFTFIAAVLIDHFVNGNTIPVAEDKLPRQLPRVTPAVVAGFKVPENVLYHPGHTWALAESPELVRVGLDDLAAKIGGPMESIDIPERGQWIRQGQRIIALHRGGKELDLVSPVEGSVVNINEKVLRDPALATSDPYGDGWLFTVNSPDQTTGFRNLLRGTIVRRWMEDAALKLRGAAHVAQDGGLVLDDAIPSEELERVQEEVFLA